MKNTIICKLCNKELGRNGISHHLKTIHSVTFENYANEHPEDFPNRVKKPCETCGKLIPHYNRFCSVECTAVWRKTLTGENGLWYGKTHSIKSKEKMSKVQSQWLEENGHWATGTHLSKKTKSKISKTRKKLGLSKGKNNPMYGKTHTPEAIKKIFKHKPMNKLEKLVADWLDEHNIVYTFQFFINTDGVCKSYDFKLKDTNTILEVHGDYWHGGSGVSKHHFDVDTTKKNDELKKQMAIDNGYNVIVLWEHDIKKNINILESCI